METDSENLRTSLQPLFGHTGYGVLYLTPTTAQARWAAPHLRGERGLCEKDSPLRTPDLCETISADPLQQLPLNFLNPPHFLTAQADLFKNAYHPTPEQLGWQ